MLLIQDSQGQECRKEESGLAQAGVEGPPSFTRSVLIVDCCVLHWC